MKLNYFIILIMLFLFGIGYTQEHVELTGQIRYRYEISERDFDKHTKPNNYNLLRSRIGLFYKPSPDISVFFQLQDSRILGEEESTLDGRAKRFDMHQAFLDINNPFNLPVALQLGRFESSYSNQRLIGAVGWSNVGRSFNGASLAYQTGRGDIDFFAYQISEKLNNGNEGDENFYGIWADLKWHEQLRSDLFVLWRKQVGTGKLSEHTLGLNLLATISNLHANIELAYQTGRLDSARDISASLIAVNLKYKLPKLPLTPTLMAGVDRLSGDNDISDNKYKVFNTLFATNHKFYGIMDFFLNIPVSTSGYGLTDVNFGLAIKINESMNGTIRAHRFYSSEDYVLSNNATANLFGDEMDLIFNYIFNKQVIVQLGGGILFPGKIFKETRGNADNVFFYTSVLTHL